MAKVVREVDCRHATPTELTLDSVAVSEGGCEGFGDLWQRSLRSVVVSYGIAAMPSRPENQPSKVLADLYSAAAPEYAELWAPVLRPTSERLIAAMALGEDAEAGGRLTEEIGREARRDPPAGPGTLVQVHESDVLLHHGLSAIVGGKFQRTETYTGVLA